MKHLRIINLLVIMLLLAGWAPAPAVSYNSSPALLQVLARPTLYSPASGVMASATTGITLKWYNKMVPTYDVQLSLSSLSSDPIGFDNILATITIDNSGNTGSYSSTVITAASLDGFPGNSKIYWHVKATSGADSSIWSATRYFYTRPKAPTGLAVTANALRPTFQWDKADTVTKYNFRVLDGALIKISKTGILSAASPVIYVPVVDLLPAHAYTFTVQSVGVNGVTSPWSAPVGFTTPSNPPGTPTLLTPANLAITSGPAAYTPTLTWDEAPLGPESGSQTFHLQVATSSTFATVLIDEPTLSETTYATGELAAGTYYWRVQAMDDRNILSNWSTTFSFKTPPSLQIKVTDFLSGKPVASAQVIISGISTLTTPLLTDAAGIVDLKSYTPQTLNKSIAGYRSIQVRMGDYLIATIPAMTYANGKLYEDGKWNIALKHLPIKIVLKWGAAPSDLDAHLWMPDTVETLIPAGKKLMQVYSNGQRGSTTAYPWMKVANDAYGAALSKTETVILQNRYPGEYRFAVLNMGPDKVGAVKPKVYVYLNGVLQKFNNGTLSYIEYSGGESFRWWNVLKIVTGDADGTVTISEVNQTSQESPGYSYDPDGGYSVSK